MCSISQTSSTTPSFRVISGLISCPVLSGSFPDFLAFCHSLTYLVDDGEIQNKTYIYIYYIYIYIVSIFMVELQNENADRGHML